MAGSTTSTTSSTDWMGGTGGATGVVDTRAIYMQAEPVSSRYDLVNWAYGLNTGQGQAFGGQSKGQPERDVQTSGGTIHQPALPTTTMTLNGMLSQLHNLPPDKLLSYTQSLYAAGLYPDRAYAKGTPPPNGKILTQDDIAATINLLSTAQGYVELNPDGSERVIKTIPEIINESIGAGLGQEKLKAGGKTQGSVYSVQTSDPATIREQVTKVGQAILGRALNDDESQALVDQMLAAEKGPDEAAIQAGQIADQGGDVRLATARVDTEARLKAKIATQNPVEALAYSQMNYVNIIRQMIGSGDASIPGGGA